MRNKYVHQKVSRSWARRFRCCRRDEKFESKGGALRKNSARTHSRQQANQGWVAGRIAMWLREELLRERSCRCPSVTACSHGFFVLYVEHNVEEVRHDCREASS